MNMHHASRYSLVTGFPDESRFCLRQDNEIRHRSLTLARNLRALSVKEIPELGTSFAVSLFERKQFSLYVPSLALS